MKTLDQLDDISWTKLKHVRGKADDVPDDLRVLAGHDDAASRQAYEDLSSSLSLELSKATLEAAPFLSSVLVADTPVPSKVRAALLLRNFAFGDARGYITVDNASQLKKLIGKKAKPLYDELLDAADVFVRWLTSDHAALRSIASYVLSSMLPLAERTQAAALEALRAEEDRFARASELLCLGAVARWTKKAADEVLTENLTHDDAVVRAAAALALAHTSDQLSEAAEQQLVEGAQQPAPQIECFPWWNGDLWFWAALTLSEKKSARAPEALLGALAVQLAADGDAELRDDRVGLAKAELLRNQFGNLARRKRPIQLSELSDAQRDTLAQLAQLGLGASASFKLPADVKGLERFLGLLPPGPLEASVTIGEETLPVRDWFAQIRRDKALRPELLEAMQQQLSKDAIFLALEEAVLHRGKVTTPVPPFYHSAIEHIGADAVPRARELAARLASAKKPLNHEMLSLTLLPLVWHGGGIDAPDLIALCEHIAENANWLLTDEILDGLPPDARERVRSVAGK